MICRKRISKIHFACDACVANFCCLVQFVSLFRFLFRFLCFCLFFWFISSFLTLAPVVNHSNLHSMYAIFCSKPAKNMQGNVPNGAELCTEHIKLEGARAPWSTDQARTHVNIYIYLSIYIYIYLGITFYISFHISFHLNISLFIHLSVYFSAQLSV